MGRTKQTDYSADLNGLSLNGNAAIISDEQERHTEEIQDIITKVPSWVIRWGIMVFFGVLLIVAVISAIVRYPDVVKARIRFLPVEKDYYVNSPLAGIVRQVYVTQGTLIKKGQLLAIINTTDGKDLNLSSPIAGRLGFAAILQPGTVIQPEQSLIVIHPRNQRFFGLIQIPVNSAGEIKVGQKVMISVGDNLDKKGSRFNGFISVITDEPDKNGMVTAEVTPGKSKELTSWSAGYAEIITSNVSVSQRIWNDIAKKM